MFIRNKEYKRSEIHDQYGGNRQKGISVCKAHPFIFIFSGKSGESYGYEDGWEDDEKFFLYTGEGTKGDMQFTAGNRALRNHKLEGRKVYLFESSAKSYVKFAGQVEYVDFEYKNIRDQLGKMRKGIQFTFVRRDQSVTKSDQLKPWWQGNREPNVTERKGLVTTRVGQGEYRRKLLERWGYQCAVTGFNDQRILIASHIVPWRDSTDFERRDVHNGILLSPLYDALFDKNLISFQNDGMIILSKVLSRDDYLKLGITGDEQIESFTEENWQYLDRHRANLL